MRRMIRTTGIVAAGFFLALGVASAADRDQLSPESRAYFSFSFGGHKVAPRELHYGLRIDHDAHFLGAGVAPPLMQFDFTRRGLSDATLNGLTVVKRKYRLQQSEPAPIEEGAPMDDDAGDAGAEGAGEGGFFSNMWGGVTGFFGGLFGGGDEEDVAEETAAAEEAPAEGAADGWFANYDVADWGLFAVGLAGVGLVASEVLGGDESLDLKDSDGDGISDDDDPTPNPPGEPCTITIPVPFPPGCDPNAFTGRQSGIGSSRADPAYQAWLDGGTGQMGDLLSR
jgi:hypothetical protein